MSRRPRAAALPDPLADVGGLRAFVAVARSGAVGRAAALLGRTQPSVSARLAALERAWGTRLFRRSVRGMGLTPEGARLLPLAEAVLRDLEALDASAGAPLSRPETLRIGAGDALGRASLPRAIDALTRQARDLDVHVREGPRPRLIEALLAGEIDLALLVRDGSRPPVAGLDLEPILESAVDLLAPRGWLGRAGRAVRLERLAGWRLVSLQPGSAFRTHLERAFVAAGLPFSPAVEVGNLSLVRRFVAVGLGVAAVPAVAFEEGAADLGVDRARLRGVPPVVYERALRPGAPVSDAIGRLLEAPPGGKPLTAVPMQLRRARPRFDQPFRP